MSCKIVPIPKHNTRNAFRPISLLLCFRKLFEKMIQIRLEWWIERQNILSPTTYGFRRNRGSAECLNGLVNSCIEAFSQKKVLLGLFLDIISAFDKVLIDKLCEKLWIMGLPARIVNIIIVYHLFY